MELFSTQANYWCSGKEVFDESTSETSSLSSELCTGGGYYAILNELKDQFDGGDMEILIAPMKNFQGAWAKLSRPGKEEKSVGQLLDLVRASLVVPGIHYSALCEFIQPETKSNDI